MVHMRPAYVRSSTPGIGCSDAMLLDVPTINQSIHQSVTFKDLGANRRQQTINLEMVKSEVALKLRYKCQNNEFADQVSIHEE